MQAYQEEDSAWRAGHQRELARLLADARKRSTERTIETIQYNFGELGDLSLNELDGLRSVLNHAIDAQIEKSKAADRKTERTITLKG